MIFSYSLNKTYMGHKDYDDINYYSKLNKITKPFCRALHTIIYSVENFQVWHDYHQLLELTKQHECLLPQC